MFVENTPATAQPPATEGGAVEPETVTQPSNTSYDLTYSPLSIRESTQMPQQPVMMGSPMVYSRVADIARTLANRGGIGTAIGTAVGVGGLATGLLSGSDGRAVTIPQQVRAVTGMSFTRKTQMAYKQLAEMTGLQNAAACLGIPEGLFCQALIHRFPTRRRGISAAQLRTAKRVNGTIARMHKELSSEFKGATRRTTTRKSPTIIAQN